MPEATARLPSGIELCYETFGRPDDPAILLLMGLGMQMIAWPEELCADLAERGHFVIRFDNRDCGLSSHLVGRPAPDPLRVLLRLAEGPYRLEEMAGDAVGLLDSLAIPDAHLVGVSMGGFIAQLVAILFPERVRSLSLLMTSTGARLVGRPRLPLILRLERRPPRRLTQGEALELVLDVGRRIGSPGYPFDSTRLTELALRSWSRSADPEGYARQLAATLGQHDRSRALGSVRVPTVVMHGLDDPLVGVSGGLALARAVPSGRFVGFPGMGHDLPRALWPRFAEEIGRTAGEAEGFRRCA